MMTIIDLLVIGLVMSAFYIFFKQKSVLENLNLQKGMQFVFIGLAIIAFFYFLDLLTMFVLPIFMPMKQAMALMKDLHLNQKWLVSLFGTGFLVIGLSSLLKTLLPNIEILMGKLKLKEQEQKNTINELSKALEDVKALRGILPICASCKSIRDDNGYWEKLENYFLDHSEVKFTHGICNDCAKKTIS